MAEHQPIFSCDTINRYFMEDDLSPYAVWLAVRDLFDDALLQKGLPFRAVLMDSWYATKDLMTHIDKAKRVLYCPLKSNQKLDDSGGERPYKAVADFGCHDGEVLRSKLVKVHGFPMDCKVKLFRVAATNR